MTDHAEIRLTEAELDAIADRISKRIFLHITPEQHYKDHIYIGQEREDKKQATMSRRKVLDTVIGAVAATALIGFLAWLGREAITFLVSIGTKT